MRLAARLIAGFASVLAGLVTAVLCVSPIGAPRPASVAAAGACLLAGFFGLAVARTPETPLRPMRMALALSIPPSAYMILGLSWPPAGAEVASFIVLTLGMILSICVLVAARRWPRVAVGLVVILAAYGVLMLSRLGRQVVPALSVGEYSGPAVTLAYVLAASVGVAWISASWHSRPLWRFMTR